MPSTYTFLIWSLPLLFGGYFSLQMFPHSTAGEPLDCTLAKGILMSNLSMYFSKRSSLENSPVNTVNQLIQSPYFFPLPLVYVFHFLFVRSIKDSRSPKLEVLSCFPKTLPSQRSPCFPWKLTLFWWL